MNVKGRKKYGHLLSGMILQVVMIKHILKILYQVIFKFIHKDCIFDYGVEFGKSCIFKGSNHIARNSILNNVEMGYMSYCGNSCYLTSVIVGKYTSIGPDVRIAVGRHPTSEFISTHPVFYSKDFMNKNYVSKNKYEEVQFAYDDGKRKYAVEIGNDVWIGAGSRIIDGVRIGDGAVVGANSLILSDVEPYSIVVGIPAKEIRKRFTIDEVNKLLSLKWWEYDEQWIISHADEFGDVKHFFERLS